MKDLFKTLFLILFLFIISNSGYTQYKEFTESDNSIDVNTDDLFSINLMSNRTTGFSWSMDDLADYAPVLFLESDYIAPQKGKLGAGGNELWKFKAIAPGFIDLVFRYKQPWDKDTPPAKTVTFHVNIR